MQHPANGDDVPIFDEDIRNGRPVEISVHVEDAAARNEHGEAGIKIGLCAYEFIATRIRPECAQADDFLDDACLGDIQLGDICDCARFVMRCTHQFVDVADPVFLEVLGQIRRAREEVPADRHS